MDARVGNEAGRRRGGRRAGRGIVGRGRDAQGRQLGSKILESEGNAKLVRLVRGIVGSVAHLFHREAPAVAAANLADAERGGAGRFRKNGRTDRGHRFLANHSGVDRSESRLGGNTCRQLIPESLMGDHHHQTYHNNSQHRRGRGEDVEDGSNPGARDWWGLARRYQQFAAVLTANRKIPVVEATRRTNSLALGSSCE